MNGRRAAPALAECAGLRSVYIGQSCRKGINASRTFRESILGTDAAERATLASTFYPSAKLTEISLAWSGALGERACVGAHRARNNWARDN